MRGKTRRHRRRKVRGRGEKVEKSQREDTLVLKFACRSDVHTDSRAADTNAP